MLVLSRRVDLEIVFPNTGISLKLLQVRGQVIKIGIQAPDDVRILRKEVCSDEQLIELAGGTLTAVSKHQVRNRLNAVNLGIHLFQKQIEAGLTQAAQATFHRLKTEIANLDSICGESKPESAAVQSPVNGRKLLVVDDDANEREMLSAILRLYGFHVIDAGDGREALKQMHEHLDLDGVLLDIRMPNCDGLETLHHIRDDKELAQLKVYAMTGISEDENEIAPRSNGFDGWFAKPLDPDRVIATVKGGFTPGSRTSSA
ncbi:Transcriptional regulatory protein ZraR [Thalassoglobus neptunius]|uniref:Translational regulator CsrA n=1 Tax=Thalassoglobus neptunius TaxID=1938619 RepID=A0A5C5X6R4_9PLAN|nr:response regulator [Thalassoglobus neptunius]TWT57835.1 Transcriptional regulatory protein ZraR [Thalassoglobus neptunius]